MTNVKSLKFLTPRFWKDYELIDCGDFEKLERFGDIILIREEPLANWPKSLPETEWKQRHNIRFKSRTATSGEWIKKDPDTPDHWQIEYRNQRINIRFRIGLTSFKHVGIFPEQAANWNFITEKLSLFRTKTPRVLNLFAYTGGASLAARAVGAQVTHVDSIRQVITWANENQELSGLSDIRWIVEDAMKFVKREVKRGNSYHGIILDPPAYGHGPRGQKWKLEEHIGEMMEDVAKLLDPKEHFLILNTYSTGFTAAVAHELVQSVIPGAANLESGELCLPASSGRNLPLSVFCRVSTH